MYYVHAHTQTHTLSLPPLLPALPLSSGCSGLGKVRINGISIHSVLNFSSRENQFKCILEFKGENSGFILLQRLANRVQGKQPGTVPRIILHKGPFEDASVNYRDRQTPQPAPVALLALDKEMLPPLPQTWPCCSCTDVSMRTSCFSLSLLFTWPPS